MRADFWGECASYTALKDEMQAHQELVAPLVTADLRGAIEQQASAVGLRFEADLAEDILDDVQGEPGAMPLLQHALLLLWSGVTGVGCAQPNTASSVACSRLLPTLLTASTSGWVRWNRRYAQYIPAPDPPG